MPRGCLQFVIVVFPDHTHLLFLVHKANIHGKLVSGTYILQTSKAKFNQYEVSSQCPLCGMEPEHLVHFMLTCEKIEEVRQPFISKLETLITSHHGSHWWNQLGNRDMVLFLFV